MTSYIKSVRAYGLYENFSLEQAFTPGVNILYGPNGSGKTTLLHILANALTGDFNRFAYLPFSTIQIDLDDIIVRLRRAKVRDEYSTQIDDTMTIELGDSQEPYRITASELEQYGTTSFAGHTKTESSWPNHSTYKQTLNIAYLPAYRNVVDAWKSNELSKEGCTVNESSISKANGEATNFTRRWLYPFLPDVSVESLVEVEWRLEIASINREVEVLNRYLDSVNRFLDRKQILVAEPPFGLQTPPVQVIFDDRLPSRGLGSLSSGERQIAIILYAATQMKTANAILIDEPEISLNVDWQRHLLKEMASQLHGKQIIVCTHSPVIAADFEDQMMEVGYFPGSEREYDQEIPF